MRILIITEDYAGRLFGGIPRVLTETCRRLVARGDEVVVLTPRLPADLPAREVVEGVQVARYDCDDSSNMRRLVSSFRASKALAVQLAREGRFDVVNPHFYLSALGVVHSDACRDTRIVSTFHGPAGPELLAESAGQNRIKALFQARMVDSMQRHILKRSHAVVAYSKYSCDLIRNMVPARQHESITVIAGAVDTDHFAPMQSMAEARSRTGLPQEAAVLLSVRRLIRRNGLDRLVAAMPEIFRQIPNALLVIVGKGEVREELEAQSESLGMGRHILFTGFVPDDDLPTYYCAADLSIMPTRALEGFGLPILESMACGTPVLGSAVGAIPEIIGGFDPDLLMPDIEPSTIAAGVVRTLESCGGDPDVRRKCREYACEHYSWDTHVDRLRELYQSC